LYRQFEARNDTTVKQIRKQESTGLLDVPAGMNRSLLFPQKDFNVHATTLQRQYQIDDPAQRHLSS
jgi:hypothetical protein